MSLETIPVELLFLPSFLKTFIQWPLHFQLLTFFTPILALCVLSDSKSSFSCFFFLSQLEAGILNQQVVSAAVTAYVCIGPIGTFIWRR
ncbi:hypothetical protein L873DRAFT_1325201 [Choiromyces venosus 120613-1]|uniref:Uncharacterized protein n=1 Tax=Choiromyces venosus 120613-1 TaxID=1336337 RepID=A0A3N4JAM3_9PEZI|nr:hypothetical protein L873DRAFT_1325201 [Choiromyces venosus 120613-1]